jgi:hypothetical protein
MAYCTIQDLRDEGVPETGYGSKTDAQLTKVITRVCAAIDNYTGRFFEPRDMTIVLDGTGARLLLLGDPIISITSIKLGGPDFSLSTAVDLDGVKIYNRHLTQRLMNPDDRESPKLEYAVDEDYLSQSTFYPDRWTKGNQNIQIVGTFGYTDWDSGDAEGVTPPLIERAAVLMCLRDMHTGYSEDDARADARNAWRVTEHKTRDQTIKYASPSSLGAAGVGGYTGDPEIDGILAQYTRPPMFGSA